MLFNTWQFILLFLPITFAVYFWLNRNRWTSAGKVWLVGASLFFYAYWDVSYLPLMAGSILFNFVVGTALARSHQRASLHWQPLGLELPRKVMLTFGVAVNLMLLAYYKYADFFIANVNAAFDSAHPLPHIILPLAISFFTFTQIVYLVDSHRGETAEYNLLNYSLFVTFFPHLIAGPIVHHRQIMPQFSSPRTLATRYSNVLVGLFIFAVGLFKKVVIADTFSVWADAGFDGSAPLNFFSGWATSLSYTFQLYFDFSGYCDMAIGASLLFNIWLPINFNSPYKALDIQDFWRRWHITLSNFLRDYLYIPMGGNRGSIYKTCLLLLITFVLGGLWHGSTWMFVIWGALHGGAIVLHRVWKGFQRPLPPLFAWLLTFAFVNVAWVFFRAKTLDDALRVLRAMVDIRSGFGASPTSTADLAWSGWAGDVLLQALPSRLIAQTAAYLAIIGAFLLITRRNTIEIHGGLSPAQQLGYGVALFTVAMYFTLTSTSSVFLYFNF